MGWISVEDRLPNELDYVDVLINAKRRVVDVDYCGSDGWWYWKPGVGWKEIKNNITHWMPLPEPPEQPK